MITNIPPRDLAIDLINRSSCRFKMAAVIADGWGIFSWGWNSSGPSGMGMHAEEHAISRANRRRLKGATITVVGMNANGNWVLSMPCRERCLPLLMKVGIGHIVWMDKQGGWNVL